MKTYLGLDISSSTIGLALIERKENNKFCLLHKEYYKPSKKDTLFETLSKTKKFISDKVKELKPDKVIIEDISEYMGGKSTSKTIIKLAVFNRTVGLTIYEECGIMPELINVNTVRSIIRPKGYKGRLAKEDVPDVVAAILKIEYDYIYKKTGKIADESYDIADAIAVALAYAATETVREQESKNESSWGV